MPASVYYYRPKAGRKDRLPSKQTRHREQGWVNNPVVFGVIEEILSRPFYGYCLASRLISPLNTGKWVIASTAKKCTGS